MQWILLSAAVAVAAVPQDPGEALRVEVVGEGPAVVLITGLLGAAEGFAEVAAELAADGRRSIVIEPLGVGRSARPPDADYSLSAQASRIAAVLDSLEVRSALVVGHAVAAGIAYRLAAARPDHARAVVALEGGAPATAGTPSLSRALRFASLLRLIGGRGLVRRLFTRELTTASVDPAWVSEAAIRDYTRGPLQDLGAAIAAYRAMSEARDTIPIEDVLLRVRCPVLVLRAEAGRVPDAEVALVQDRVGLVEVRRIAGVGVFPHEERPTAVADAIVAFDPAGRGALAAEIGR